MKNHFINYPIVKIIISFKVNKGSFFPYNLSTKHFVSKQTIPNSIQVLNPFTKITTEQNSGPENSGLKPLVLTMNSESVSNTFDLFL